MDKYRFVDITIIPFFSYLFIGLFLMQSLSVMNYQTGFVLCASLAGVMLGIQRWFANRVITWAIAGYGVVVVLGLMYFRKEDGWTLTVLFLASIGGILLLRFLMKYQWVRILIGYAALVSLIVARLLQVSHSKIIIVIGAFLLLYSISETLALFYAGNVQSLVIIFALVSCITFVMPVSEEPYDWAFVFKIVDTVTEFADRAMEEIQYLLNINSMQTGHSDSILSFPENLLEQDVRQLLLQGNRTARNMYLRGNVYNEFTGQSWELSIEEGQNYQIDTLMTLYAIFSAEEDYFKLRDYIAIKEQTIFFENIRTHSLFYPLKLLSISAENTSAHADCLKSVELNEKGDSYTYTFVDIDYANSDMKEIMRNSHNIVYEEDMYNHVYEVLDKYFNVSLEKIPFSEFVEQVEAQKELIENRYVAWEEHVSDEVQALTLEQIKETETDYDSCKALEKFLYQYTYNTTLEAPQNVNMLDWFLLEEKEGYCVHFASALSLMLRCSGIPARLSEGYLVDYGKHADGYTYIISSNRAHAWVEAYLEGFGWVRLEPTVIYAENANKAWYGATYSVEEEEEITETEVTEEEEILEEADTTEWNVFFVVLGGMAAVVGISAVILFWVKNEQRKKSNNPEVVLNNVLRILGKKYISKDSAETLREYFARLEENEITEETRNNLPKIRKIMEDFWYGKKTPSQEEIEFLKTFMK